MEKGEYLNEIMSDNSPKPVNIKTTEEILKQMKHSICKIFMKGGKKGSGFFIHFHSKNKHFFTLITNYHVVDEKYVNEFKEIVIRINNDNLEKIINLSNNNIYYYKDYDTTIIEMKEIDEKNIYYLEMDKEIFNESRNYIFDKKSIYNISYINGSEATVSYSIIKGINDYKIKHLCTTDFGASGSPIINLENNKVIGIHNSSYQNNNIKYNIATFLNFPIKEFIKENYLNVNEPNSKNNNFNYNSFHNNKPTLKSEQSYSNIHHKNFEFNKIFGNINYSNKEIIKKEKKENIINMKIFIEENDIDKKIYFFQKDFNELSSDNISLYINNKKHKFKNYFKEKNKGVYSITLKFKIKIKSCKICFMIVKI